MKAVFFLFFLIFIIEKKDEGRSLVYVILP